MSESSPNIVDKIARGKYWLGVAMWVVATALTIGVSYTTATFTKGADAQRLLNVENDISELKRQVESSRDRYAAKDDINRQLDAQTKTLDRIEKNVDALRNAR